MKQTVTMFSKSALACAFIIGSSALGCGAEATTVDDALSGSDDVVNGVDSQLSRAQSSPCANRACTSDTASNAGSGAAMPVAAAEHMHASTGNVAPAPAPAPVPAATDAGSAHEHAAAAGGSSSAPKVDVSAIPTGDPGSSDVRIEPTDEKPAVGDGIGAFRNECGFSHMSFDDPIVFPGQPGKAHLHAFFGNTGVDANSTATSIRTTGNSTCRAGIANRTGYWVPALLEATGQPIEPIALEVYYKSGYNGVAPGAIKAFPKGLRMVAGNAKSSAAQTVAYWGCHGGTYIGKPGSIPDCRGRGDGVVMIVEFPQCWDGQNLDSEDHKSHMAYAQGGCPATHPVPIPAITFNIVYPLPANPNGSRLASDMYDPALPGGFSAHADWFDGWDPDVVQAFVSNCINRGVDCHSHLLGDGRKIF